MPRRSQRQALSHFRSSYAARLPFWKEYCIPRQRQDKQARHDAARIIANPVPVRGAFLDLPPEIRTIVYKHVFDDPATVSEGESFATILDQPASGIGLFAGAWGYDTESLLNLARTCKALHSEIVPLIQTWPEWKIEIVDDFKVEDYVKYLPILYLSARGKQKLDLRTIRHLRYDLHGSELDITGVGKLLNKMYWGQHLSSLKLVVGHRENSAWISAYSWDALTKSDQDAVKHIWQRIKCPIDIHVAAGTGELWKEEETQDEMRQMIDVLHSMSNRAIVNDAD